MKRVAILTNFSDYLSSFSPLILAGEQVRMLVEHGYTPKLIVTEGFVPPSDSPLALAEMAYLPQIGDRSEDSRQDPNFTQDIDDLKDHLLGHLKDVDVCITHDLLFLPDYTKYNIAARAVADELPNLRWLHWIHSCTSIGTLQKERAIFGDKYAEYAGRTFPNSFLVYPNSYDAPRVAKNLGFSENQIKVVPHAHSIENYSRFHPITKELVRSYDLYSADVIAVYPLRLDRGKQPHIVMEIMAEVKRAGSSVRCIFVDFHSTGGDKVTYREEIKTNGAKLGLSSDDLIFVSETDEECTYETPREVVADLMELATVCIVPSRSETYSLVAQEAMVKGALVVLNHDFPPFYSIYGDLALYYKFSSEYDIMQSRSDANGRTETTYQPSSTSYFADIAKKIIFESKDNKILAGKRFIRQQRNPDFVFKNYIEPLIYSEVK